MERRSTNPNGGTHYQYDVTAGVGSSHGVRLTGGSTGGIVEAVGDDTNVTLTLRGQGAGGIVLGQASTASISAMTVALLQFTVPALTTSGIAPVESTLAYAGMTTNSIYFVSRRAPYNSTLATSLEVLACPATAGLRLTFFNHGASSLSGSTASAYLLRVAF